MIKFPNYQNKVYWFG